MTLIRLLLTQNLPKGEQSSLSVQECPSALTAVFEALLFHSFVFSLFFFLLCCNNFFYNSYVEKAAV